MWPEMEKLAGATRMKPGLCGNPGLIPAHKTKWKISENGRNPKADGRAPPCWTVKGDPHDRVFMGLGKPDKVLL